LVLDIAAFLEVAEFKRRLDETIDDIKACRKRSGVKEILVPGERSHENARRNRERGILIEESTQKELKILCEELGVAFALEAAPVLVSSKTA
jgi:L-2-hydroxycarboxylate dehydrogenase (NAD+)